jgi:hypothetical protein
LPTSSGVQGFADRRTSTSSGGIGTLVESGRLRKVNRAITEGRARFLRSFRAIESGEACERLEPVLAALADGRATGEQLRAARPHLRHCAACRAALRALHAPWRRRVAARLPLPGLLGWLQERMAAPAPRPPELEPTELRSLQGVPDLADALARVPVDAAPTIADRASRLRLPALLHRLTGSDVATGVQLASTSGGGRTAAVATAIGFCISGVGAGTYCAATALLPDPPPRKEQRAEHARRGGPPRSPAPEHPPRRPEAGGGSGTGRRERGPAPAPTPRPTPRPEREFGFEAEGTAAAPAAEFGPAPATGAPPTASAAAEHEFTP